MRIRGLPPELVWLALIIFSITLADTRTANGRFQPEEGLLWVWGVSAFGIVATLSPLVAAQRTRGRTARTFIEAFFGALLVDMILGAHVNELNAPEVGEIEGVLTFFSHCLVIAAMAFVISLSDQPRRQRVLRPLYVFAAGVVAVAAFSFFLSWNSFSMPPDSTGGLKGIARADFLGKRAGSMDSDRKLIRDGVLYKVYDWQTVHYVIVSRGKDFAFEVPVPFPNGAAKRDMIVGLAKSAEVQRLFGLPRRGWEIAWVDRDLEPYTQPTLIFRLRRPIEEVDAFGVDEMLQQATRTSVATVHFREVVDVLLQMTL